MQAPILSIIFSFRNEEHVLQELISRVRAVLTKEKEHNAIAGWELIFVNDASNDRSLEVLLRHAQNTKDIKIITMSRVFGVAPCVMAGLAQAQGDAAIYMDADLQDPPELIPEMLKAMREQNADVVHTVRRSRQGESAFKLFITKIGYRILNRYSTVPIPQEAGDFKLLSRRVIDHLLLLKEINPFMRGLVAWVGFKQVFIAYDRQARFAGKSKFFVLGKKVISNFLNSAIINFSSVPLKIASYCGLSAILVSILFAMNALIQNINGAAIPGWTALMLVIIFIGGVQLFCIGMIGLYLNAVHEQSKMRPNYIIESTYGINPRA
ncbi:MAG: glycosyltransferase family 2 protein [Candidatus Omnitrophota bacterium]|nr:glycosyltransferase family 2 protein [Candidatus Omnitrophota bacterium]